jgi:hypothetical protein
MQEINRAYLGTTFFATPEYQDKYHNDNTSIQSKYTEESTKKEVISYGRIRKMFHHQLLPERTRRVIVIADWYDYHSVSKRNGLVQVKYNSNFKSEASVFLNYCTPKNHSMWPTDPYTFGWTDKDYRDEDVLFSILDRYSY